MYFNTINTSAAFLYNRKIPLRNHFKASWIFLTHQNFVQFVCLKIPFVEGVVAPIFREMGREYVIRTIFHSNQLVPMWYGRFSYGMFSSQGWKVLQKFFYKKQFLKIHLSSKLNEVRYSGKKRTIQSIKASWEFEKDEKK